jgi:hypothetical protein
MAYYPVMQPYFQRNLMYVNNGVSVALRRDLNELCDPAVS